MDAYLPDEVKQGIAKARKRAQSKRNRLRVHAGELEIPVRELQPSGFTVDAKTTALRGLIDLYDGSRHLFQCLIIRSETRVDTILYEFKRRTEVKDDVPLDYERDENGPVALLR